MKTRMGFGESVATLERAAERFFRKQAQMSRNRNTQEILESIAEEDAGHAESFSSMGEDPGYVAAFEAAASAAGPILEPLRSLHAGMGARIVALGTERDIFDLALVLERETLVFYKALLDAIKPAALKARIRSVFMKVKGHFGKIRALRASWGPLAAPEDVPGVDDCPALEEVATR
jgi:rubrerythrin